MKNLWLIGAGKMAQDYSKVLDYLKVPVVVIGRGSESAKGFKKDTGHSVVTGGLLNFLKTEPEVCSHAIVSVGVDNLYETTKLLLECGVKSILVEKPGALNKKEFIDLKKIQDDNKAKVFIAYNRRFYAATKRAIEIIKADGGVSSFNFEFTEWSHIIENLSKPKNVFETWFLGNSSHVVDLAFFLGGKPKEISSFTSGELNWHTSASVFTGAGISDKGALFSYQANWEAPGRWSVEILTKKSRLIFKPMEKLQIQKIGAVSIDFVEIEDEMDNMFKPGLYSQVKNFIEGDFAVFCTLEWQIDIIDTYNKMANYN